MSALVSTLDGGWAVVKRDLLLMLSYRLRLVTMTLGAFFTLTLFYYISRLVSVRQFDTPDDYYAFAVVGLIVLQLINAVLQTPPTTLRQELVAGTFERIVLSPFGAVGGVVSLLVFPFLMAVVLGVLMLGFAGLVFGVPVEWETAPLAIPVAALAAMAFAPFGLLLLAAVLVFKQALGGATWIVALISLVAGLYFPVGLLPDWIEWLSEVQPFTPAVDLMRHVLVGTDLQDPAWTAVARLVGFSAVLLPVATWLTRAALRTARRRGTIIEY
jgi:ABC-2 type transport system permease protein